MSPNGQPGSVSQHPAVRKLDAKVLMLDKYRVESEKKITTLEAQILELQTQVRQLMQALSNGRANAAAAPQPAPIRRSEPAPQGVRVVEAVSPTRPASIAPTMSVQRIDAVLSNLGIRLIQIQSNECELESMNAFGQENLARLHGDHSLPTVERFVRAREHLA